MKNRQPQAFFVRSRAYRPSYTSAELGWQSRRSYPKLRSSLFLNPLFEEDRGLRAQGKTRSSMKGLSAMTVLTVLGLLGAGFSVVASVPGVKASSNEDSFQLEAAEKVAPHALHSLCRSMAYSPLTCEVAMLFFEFAERTHEQTHHRAQFAEAAGVAGIELAAVASLPKGWAAPLLVSALAEASEHRLKETDFSMLHKALETHPVVPSTLLSAKALADIEAAKLLAQGLGIPSKIVHALASRVYEEIHSASQAALTFLGRALEVLMDEWVSALLKEAMLEIGEEKFQALCRDTNPACRKVIEASENTFKKKITPAIRIRLMDEKIRVMKTVEKMLIEGECSREDYERFVRPSLALLDRSMLEELIAAGYEVKASHLETPHLDNLSQAILEQEAAIREQDLAMKREVEERVARLRPLVKARQVSSVRLNGMRGPSKHDLLEFFKREPRENSIATLEEMMGVPSSGGADFLESWRVAPRAHADPLESCPVSHPIAKVASVWSAAGAAVGAEVNCHTAEQYEWLRRQGKIAEEIYNEHAYPHP